MNTNQKYMLEAYMKPLYDGSPEGPLLESVRSLDKSLQNMRTKTLRQGM